MKISIIAALSRNRVIGINNTLPWRLPADLKHFRQVTMGKPIIMGRKTFESIGKALPGRRNIIISRNPAYLADDCTVADSVDAALSVVNTDEEALIIGGASLYEQVLPLCTHMYLTIIDHDFDGDAFFPEFDASQWREIKHTDHGPDDANPYHYRFVVLERTAGQGSPMAD